MSEIYSTRSESVRAKQDEMGLKAAVAEIEVMGLGKGTEWGQGGDRVTTNTGSAERTHSGGILECRASPKSFVCSASRKQWQRALGMPLSYWEASFLSSGKEKKGWEEGWEADQELSMELPSAFIRESLGKLAKNPAPGVKPPLLWPPPEHGITHTHLPPLPQAPLHMCWPGVSQLFD